MFISNNNIKKKKKKKNGLQIYSYTIYNRTLFIEKKRLNYLVFA